MTDWRNERRECGCGATFRPKRQAQRHCCSQCRVKDAMARYRSDNKNPDPTRIPRSDNTPASEAPTPFSNGSTMVWPESPSMRGLNPDGSTPGALQGDDYGLDYFEDGYPKLPACLDRRPKLALAEAA